MLLTAPPVEAIVVRERLPVNPIMYAYGGLPIVPERRYRVRSDGDGAFEVTGFPYWPLDALRQGRPKNVTMRRFLRESEVRERHASISYVYPEDDAKMRQDSLTVVDALGGGFWSVDWMRTSRGMWKLIDMARGEASWWPDDPQETAGQ